MTERKCLVFSFADIEVRESEFCIIRGGEVLAVEPRAFRVLVFLLRNPQKLITKGELLDAVWGDIAVSENSLTRSVALLRKLLGDDTHEPRFIATVPTVGYRFLCDVQITEDGFASSHAGSGIRKSSAEPASEALPPPRTEENSRLRISLLLVALVACILLVGAGWFAYRRWRATIPAPPVQRALTRLTSDDGLQTGATWSPDGRFIAYSSDRGGKYEIWIQQISGGDPIQITKGPEQNWMPDWSPDGKYIAYRSEEGEGGIYITPALGGVGQQRKLASFGYYPHWSPDSSHILFQPGFGFLGKNLYVVGLDGSPPREVMTDHSPHTIDMFATWHPDGKRITTWIFDYAKVIGNPGSPTPNFLTKAVDGGPAIESRFPPELQKQIEAVAAAPGIAEWRMDFRFAWAPSGRAIYFERTFRGARNVWRMTVDPVTLQATRVERLTTSPGLDAELSISPDGSRLAFTSERQQVRAWVFPFDANHGQVTGPGQPVTSPGIEAWSLNLSRDGTRLMVGGNHDGQGGTWETLLPNGREEPLVADDSYNRDAPIWSPDGKRAAYVRWQSNSDKVQVVVWSSDHRNEDPVEAGRSAPAIVFDWFPNGKSVLMSYWNTPTDRPSIWQLFVDPSLTGESSAHEIASDPNYDLYQPHISPDGRWIVFEAVQGLLNSALFVIPAAGGPWVRITDGRQWDDKPRWSPDGKTIYYLSGRKSFFNVWGVHFDPAKGKPQGEPFQVTTFETPTLMIPKHMPSVEFSLTDGRLVLPMAQTSGNIWILDNVDQ
ncbi:winged helix-turn-helix domain-containing protein [Alloacidobacterium sp.]|uniref:winged helix-turn-helix domain-containing protein n=1 Tax=Alloacidobacterium sp. TaxID=2951999 RepID=UPI002D38133D|nr:winged helix-turn-helix domain-containing protein [Alloacidobacterium sp.]HYK34452.1 winged helix-turn-helix domain-containing protein [Alloacidobacterium sp.]